jgi:CheY-like chemotaxis protein
MNDPIKAFGDTAARLSRNPLGIIALFIVLVYGFASYVTNSTNMTPAERMPLIYFLVFFPVIVLAVFAWLVSQHWRKLYGPGDFKDEHNYVTVVASLAAATVRRPDGATSQENVDVRAIAKTVENFAFTSSTKATVHQAHVLWVDDRPDNNVYERQAFEALGITFALANSTNQALELLKGNSFAAIISDMGREEGPKEGYVLLDALRETGDLTPFFIYAGSNSPAHKREAAKHGGQGTTNNPQELFEMVTAAVISKQA